MRNSYDKLLNMLETLGLSQALEYVESHKSTLIRNKVMPLDFLEEVVADDYLTKTNKRYDTLIRASGVLRKRGDFKELYSHDGRTYDDEVLNQVKDFTFLENGKNVCVFGASGAGKTYLLTSVVNELCKKGIRPLFIDFVKLSEDIVPLKNTNNALYLKKFRALSTVPVLVIDDFLSVSPNVDTIVSLFQITKVREDRGLPIMIGTQYAPEEWPDLMSKLEVQKTRKGEADSIRRRIIDNAYIVRIDIS